MSSADETTRPHGSSHEEQTHRKGHMHEYAGGYIQAHHGGIPAWLLVVYAVLLVWGLYYAYVYWGSLGPGLGQAG
jgi:uncharacterized membrane protein